MNGPLDHLDHEGCSSALDGLLAGELDEPTRTRVEEHLTSCADCRAELDATRALHELREARLTEHERHRLHERVHSLADRTQGSPTTTLQAPKRPLGERLVPVLAAAAIVAVIGVGAASVLTGGGGSGDRGGGGATDGAAVEPQMPEGHSAGAGQGRARARYLGDVGEVERGDLLELASRPIADQAFGPAEGNLSTVRGLTREAPAAVASQIRRCLAPTADRQRLRPGFAATGRLDDRRVVVVGFRIGATDRYSVWTWPRGECGTPLLVESGRRR
jgi:hypothetical protein